MDYGLKFYYCNLICPRAIISLPKRFKQYLQILCCIHKESFNIPYPVDCWRVLPGGFRYLLEKQANFEIIKCVLNKLKPRFRVPKFFPAKVHKFIELISGIQDTYIIAKKK